MHILHAVFHRKPGGMEESFLNYCHAMISEGHKLTILIRPDAPCMNKVIQLGVDIEVVKNFGYIDVFSMKKCRKLIEKKNPDVIVAHGNRAISYLKRAAKGICPIVAVNHSNNMKRSRGVDAVITVNSSMIDRAKNQNVVHEDYAYVVPNMIEVPRDFIPPTEIDWFTPPSIGMLCALEVNKNVDVFLKAISILKEREVPCRAVVGGAGDEIENLKDMAAELNIPEKVEFLGWVTDKDDFFEQLDIFCMLSNDESFGIVILEAFLNGKPVISTPAEGPLDIIKENRDGLFVPRADAEALANTIESLLKDKKMALDMVKAGAERLKKYEMITVAKKLTHVLAETVARVQMEEETGEAEAV